MRRTCNCVRVRVPAPAITHTFHPVAGVAGVPAEYTPVNLSWEDGWVDWVMHEMENAKRADPSSPGGDGSYQYYVDGFWDPEAVVPDSEPVCGPPPADVRLPTSDCRLRLPAAGCGCALLTVLLASPRAGPGNYSWPGGDEDYQYLVEPDSDEDSEPVFVFDLAELPQEAKFIIFGWLAMEALPFNYRQVCMCAHVPAHGHAA